MQAACMFHRGLRAGQLAAIAPRIAMSRQVSAPAQSRSVLVQCGKPRESFAATRPWSEQALAPAQQRWMSAAKGKMVAPKMVYISGEEMTTYCMNLIMDKWIKPHVDTSAWEFYDLSCKSRDATNDKVLKDAVEAGARIGAIFKEPTITPSAEQTKSMGLKKQARHIYVYVYVCMYVCMYIYICIFIYICIYTYILPPL